MNVIKKTAVAIMFIGALGLSFTVSNVFADYYEQETEATDEQMERAKEEIEISDADIQRFAKAQTKILQLEQKFASQFAETTEPEEQQALMEQANEEMMAVIEDVGLEVDYFNQMALQMHSDPELQEKLRQALEE